MKEKSLLEKFKDEVEVVIAIQKIGKATIEEIGEFTQTFGNPLKIKKIQNLCDKLQKKGIISISYTEGIKSYSMSKGIFSRGGPPIAHFNDIVSPQDESIADELKELISLLEEKKGINKGRKPDICDYYLVNVTFKLIRGNIYGFWPINSERLEHYRDQKGKIIFLPKHFRAWLRCNARLVNKTDSIKDYIGFNYGEVKLSGNTSFESGSILDGRQGRGIQKWETIPVGSEISTTFSVPATIFKKEDFREFLNRCSGDFSLRGFGGRSSQNKPIMEIVAFN